VAEVTLGLASGFIITVVSLELVLENGIEHLMPLVLVILGDHIEDGVREIERYIL
jgi:hypothetical protein